MSAKNLVCMISKDSGFINSLKATFKAAGMTLLGQPTITDFIQSLDPEKPVSCVMTELAAGQELLKELADVHWVIPVVLLGTPGSLTPTVQAMKAGAYDVVDRADALPDAAKKAGGLFARAQKLLEEKALAAERIDSLTKREVQVLHLMVEGRPNREIAEELGISTKTLDIHRANLMDKMEARTSADMCRAYLVHKTHPMHLLLIAG